MNKEEIIKNGYIAYGFPGESRLYALLHKDHKQITQFINHIKPHEDQNKDQ